MAEVLRMIDNASGPDGTWTAGYQYSVPDQMPQQLADEFVAQGAAVWLEEKSVPDGPSPGGRAPKH